MGGKLTKNNRLPIPMAEQTPQFNRLSIGLIRVEFGTPQHVRLLCSLEAPVPLRGERRRLEGVEAVHGQADVQGVAGRKGEAHWGGGEIKEQKVL